jgi:hypothetical protein
VGPLPQPGPDPLDELVEVGRLDDVVVGAGGEARHHGLGAGPGGEHHDHGLGEGAAGANPAADLEPVHPRHHDVEHHGVGAFRGGQANGLRRLSGGEGVEVGQPEAQLDEPADHRIVVHHHDPRGHIRSYGRESRQVMKRASP